MSWSMLMALVLTSPWHESFPKEPICAALADRGGYLVAKAGASDPDLDAAADVFFAVLKACSGTPFVLDGRLVDIGGDRADDALVAQAAKSPAQHIIVLRLFREGDQVILVGREYNKKGAAGVQFSATPGRPISLEAAVAGVGRETFEAVEEASRTTERKRPFHGKAAPKDEAPPRRGSEERQIGFVDVLSSDGRLLVRRPYLGDVARPLEGASFYEAVGRADLAEQYRNRNETRTLLWSGFIGGMVLTQVVGQALLFNAEVVRGARTHTTAGAGAGVLVGGTAASLALMCWALSYDPHPVSAADMGELASEYNNRMAFHDAASPSQLLSAPATTVAFLGGSF